MSWFHQNSGVQRTRSLAEYLDTAIAIVDQDEADGGYVIGDVVGKNVFWLMTF